MLKYTCLFASVFAVSAVYAAAPEGETTPQPVSEAYSLWNHLLSLGPAAKAPVSLVIRGEKPTEADLTALNNAYTQHLEVVKDDAIRQRMGELQGRLETLLSLPEEFNKMREADGVELAYVATEKSPLTLRDGADFKAAKKASIPKDALVRILDTQGGWYHVQALGNADGYASKEFLKPLKLCQHSAIVHTKKSPLVLRASADVKAAKLTDMPKGSSVCLTGDCQDGWCPVKFDTYNGFAAQEFLAIAKE